MPKIALRNSRTPSHAAYHARINADHANRGHQRACISCVPGESDVARRILSLLCVLLVAVLLLKLEMYIVMTPLGLKREGGITNANRPGTYVLACIASLWKCSWMYEFHHRQAMKMIIDSTVCLQRPDAIFNTK